MLGTDGLPLTPGGMSGCQIGTAIFNDPVHVVGEVPIFGFPGNYTLCDQDARRRFCIGDTVVYLRDGKLGYHKPPNGPYDMDCPFIPLRSSDDLQALELIEMTSIH